MISKEEVQHIAKLARIGLTEDEIKRFQKDLSSILDYFDSLKKVDVSKVEPTFYLAQSYISKGVKIMRKDKVEAKEEGLVNKLVEAAPEREKRHIKTKPIL